MTAPLKSIEGISIAAAMADIGRRAQGGGARARALPDGAARQGARRDGAGDPRQRSRDSRRQRRGCRRGESRRRDGGLPRPPRARRKRVAAMADGIEVVRELADPVGAVTESWTRPNGMTIERVRVPLGVVGVIYESRPNVTADAAVLCLKAGNAVILRGGSESSAPRARSMRRWSKACAPPTCRRMRSSWCRRATAPRSA